MTKLERVLTLNRRLVALDPSLELAADLEALAEQAAPIILLELERICDTLETLSAGELAAALLDGLQAGGGRS